MSGEAPIPTTSESRTFKSKVEWGVLRSTFDKPWASTDDVWSKEFRASPDSKVSWQLLLYPHGDIDENRDRDYVSLYLGAWEINDPVRAKYKLGFIGSDGTEKNALCADDTFSKGDWCGWGWAKFIRRDVLLDPTKNFFRGDQLTIFCDIEVYWDLEVKVPESTLSNDWSGILDSGEFSDVVLVVEEDEIKAHKVVLSVFAAMFRYNMKESQTGRVLIEDLDVIGVKALLKFLYSVEINDLKEIAEKVLPAADKYGVERLKIMCEKEIFKKLTVENSVDMLFLAELHTAKQLKAQVISFIVSNKSEVVQQASFWRLNDANKKLFEEVVKLAIQLGNDQIGHADGAQVKRRKLN